VWLTLGSQIVSRLQSAKGLLLGPSSSDYMVLLGVGGAGGAAAVAGSKVPVLEITYTVLV
jgi:hypothetical protein